MFDVGAPELLVIAIVALLVVGPKDLPRLLRTVGNWIGKARATARHFRTGVDAMIREAEMEDMQKQWEMQNAAIMKAHPAGAEAPSAPDAPSQHGEAAAAGAPPPETAPDPDTGKPRS
ncbi:Sec-independent protein translocase protein TatB [Sphingosinicella soli]|uniref:Sec-independent protein translocase protein TatB n=1 Tax=Sphingosinicella soli TaxID=333708 RepID=A0A7W7B0M0_9SPHN|nr:Sec-independent protein translocase protein TatB [Sphingosinicella soli]MBB4631842.1 sec-independent protein translocase protein TatB [Sphingosinicella soli]